MHFFAIPHPAWKIFSNARIRQCRRDQLQRAQGKKIFSMLEFNLGVYGLLKKRALPAFRAFSITSS
jgi:hypothetical protein